MQPMKTPTSAQLVLSIALAAGSIALAAEPATRPKDAAEAVQEGNVSNWVEYYERERRESARKPAAASPPAPAPAATTRPETPPPER
jgi:hypothetical protein